MSETANHAGLNRAGLRSSILEFLAAANDDSTGDGRCGTDVAALDDDDNIFDLGLVDSLTLAELLVRVEQVSGVELDLLAVEPETFFTLRGLLSHVEHLRSASRGQPR